MDCTRKAFVSMLATGSAMFVAGCSAFQPDAGEPQGDAQSDNKPAEEKEEPQEPKVDLKEFEKLAINMDAWRYDSENDVYYQLGIPYCLKAATDEYGSMAIFVPGAYFTGEENGRTYKCKVNKDGKVASFTAATAPIAMPINSGNLSAQTSPTTYEYAGLESYLSAGIIYVYAGFRGRNAGYASVGGGAYAGGDPWPLVDFKAAVRCLRYNADVLPGNMDRVFTFGFSMGGGMSALMGASGDSPIFEPYLEEIGAATHDAEGKSVSDATYGSASWCPVTSFDSADASYEWMMGQYSDEGVRADGTWTRQLSRDLAVAYGHYVNGLGLKGSEGEELTLDETSGEIFADGSYYNYLVELVQNSANAFFEHTEFPYTYTPQYAPNASFPGDPSFESIGAGGSDVEKATGDASAQAAGVSNERQAGSEGMAQVNSVVYSTQNDYVNDLNSDVWWLTFNETNATVRVSGLGYFVRRLKSAAKDVCAFDALDRSTVENQLFGVDDAGSLHFSSMVRDTLDAGSASYAKDPKYEAAYLRAWTEDLEEVDALGTNMEKRMGMFNPLYFLNSTYEGAGTSKVAAHWRINSGLFQTDTSLCTEANLAIALRQAEGVADVEFTPVWGQGHMLAEVTGSAEGNLVAWMLSCCEEKAN